MPRVTPLVAREQTLNALWLQVAASASSGMRAAVLRGPAGSGKTRVLEAFAERARQAGATVVAGRAAAVGGHPYAALADALAAYVRSSAPAGGVVRRAGDALVGLVPQLAVLEGSAPPGSPDALAVVQAGYRLVRQVTERRPLVLVVDDAHLADSESCEALDALQRHAADLPWTLVLGWRDPSEEVRPAARRLLDALRREREAVDVELSPLDLGAAAEMIAALLGEGLPAPGLVETVHARAAGNPYYMEEMVRWLQGTGRLQRAGLQWLASPGSEAELPPSLEEALRERVRSLPAEARDALGWLAAAGGTADLRLLESVSSLSALALADGLAALVRTGLVEERGGRRAEYRVHHPLVGECAYRDMSLAHRRLAHAALARALGARGDPPGAVASHFVRAAEPGDAEALAATLAAGEAAEQRVHLAQAVAWYEEALGLAAGGEADAPGRLRALDRLSELAGHAGRTEVGLRAIEELLARTPAGDGMRRAQLLRRLATLRVITGEHDRARDAIEEGLALVAGAGREAAMMLAELTMLAVMDLPIPEVLAIAERGRAAAEAAASPGAVAVFEALRSVGLSNGGQPGAALELAVEAGRRAMAAGEFLSFGYAAFAAGLANFFLGRFTELIQSLEAFAPVGEEVGLVWGAAWVWQLLGAAQYFTGDFDAALRSSLHGEELCRRHGIPDVLPMALVTTALVLTARGELATAADRLEEGRRVLAQHGLPLAGAWQGFAEAQLATAQGRYADAVDACRRVAAVCEGRGDFAHLALCGALPLALAACGRGAEALAEASALASRGASLDLPLVRIAADGGMAAALVASGRAAEGLAMARRLVAQTDSLGARLLAAEARGILGFALVAAGERGEAREVLLDLHARAVLLGMPLMVERVRGQLAGLGVTVTAPVVAGAVGAVGSGLAAGRSVGPAGAPHALDGLSRREREVAELAASGIPARSIALRLSLSERTVENHLQRIYAKLGVHSRAELIARLAGMARPA